MSAFWFSNCVLKMPVFEWNGPKNELQGQVLSFNNVFLKLLFKTSLMSFCAFPICANLVSRKRLVVERNGPKFGPQGYILGIYRVLLTINCSRSVWGHSVHFRCSTELHSHLSYIAIYLVATWLLAINRTCSYMASDQADRQGSY